MKILVPDSTADAIYEHEIDATITEEEPYDTVADAFHSQVNGSYERECNYRVGETFIDIRHDGIGHRYALCYGGPDGEMDFISRILLYQWNRRAMTAEEREEYDRISFRAQLEEFEVKKGY